MRGLLLPPPLPPLLLLLLVYCSVVYCSFDVAIRQFDLGAGRRPAGRTGMLRGMGSLADGSDTIPQFCGSNDGFDGCAAGMSRLLAEVQRVEASGGVAGGRSRIDQLIPEAETFVGQMFRAPHGSQKAQRKLLAESKSGGGTKGARRANRRKGKEKLKQSEATQRQCSESFGPSGSTPNAGSQARCLISNGEHIAAVEVIDGYLEEQVSRYGEDWTLLVQRAPPEVPQTMVLTTFALGLLQEWL